MMNEKRKLKTKPRTKLDVITSREYYFHRTLFFDVPIKAQEKHYRKNDCFRYENRRSEITYEFTADNSGTMNYKVNIDRNTCGLIQRRKEMFDQALKRQKRKHLK